MIHLCCSVAYSIYRTHLSLSIVTSRDHSRLLTVPAIVYRQFSSLTLWLTLVWFAHAVWYTTKHAVQLQLPTSVCPRASVAPVPCALSPLFTARVV